MTLAELYKAKIPKPKQIVKDILPEGLILLVGSPKTGKSFLNLHLINSIVHGKNVFGKYPTLETGAGIYYALEDGPGRVLERTQSLNIAASKSFIVEFSLNNLDAGGIEQVRRQVRQNQGTQIVIIDVLNRVKAKRGTNGDIYQEDVDALVGLHDLALELHIAIIVVHHTNKGVADAIASGDPYLAISGTQGIAATVDAIWLLHRPERKPDGLLIVTGRDIADQKIRLRFENGMWLAQDADMGEGIEDVYEPELILSRKESIIQTVEGVLTRNPRRPVLRKDVIRAVLEGEEPDPDNYTYEERVADAYLSEEASVGRVMKRKKGRETQYLLAPNNSQQTLAA